MYKWQKKLTASEAIRPNQGAAMPFIRCTQAGHPIDHATWFRSSFFANAGWTKSTQRPEVISVPFTVTIGGISLGLQYLDVDYDPRRSHNHGAPTVHIIYNSTIDAALQATNMTNHLLTMTSHNGTYTLDIA